MIDWRLGTMGFGYDDWSGIFYPPDLKSTDYLSFYSRYFDAVELDTTFHATPTAERVARWAEATPEGFRFCVKTPKDVTHAAGLPGLAGRTGPMLEFVEAVRGFGEKLGVVLIQFPPSFDASATKDLDTFLSELPDDVRFAVEFRNPSWDAERTADVLRDHRCGWVAADYLTGEPWEITATTDFLYARWVGRHGQYPTLDKERIDATERLQWWKRRIDACAAVHTVWGFFNNDYTGFAIGTANRMRRIVGQPVRRPEDPAQGQLF